MNLKSYLQTRAPVFTESEIAPIHLADLNGRHYYAFAEDVTPPSGGKAVPDNKLKDVISNSQLIRQIKEEAGRRITDIAPVWKQQNALADLYLLGDRTDLTDAEQETLTKAQDLLAQVQVLRERSNAIEASFLSGVAVDYLTDKAWGSPRMPNNALSEALREAYASAPSDIVILHTLELRHPSFIDDDGLPMAIRVVRDNQNLTARMEATAPLNAGEMVEFIAMGFDLELPPVDTAPVPEISITLDNVSREIVTHLDRAAESQDKIEITYRPYLSDDLEGPQMDPPFTLVLTEVSADASRVTGKARMLDVGNKAFPSETYNALRFAGLTR